jgi:uncharacterized protein YndB with AHSA1/START domain
MPVAVVTRSVPAPPARCWRAFTVAEELVAWFWPASFGTEAAIEARPRGGLRIAAPARDMGVRGRVLEAEAPRHLLVTWRWDGELGETVVAIDVEAEGDGSGITVRHDGFATDAEARDHEQGWSDCLDRLAGYLEV